MLLQQIVGKLDEELNRLQRLREIMAGLGRSVPGIELKAGADEAAIEPAAASTVHVPRVRRRSAPRPRASASEKPQTALTGAIPAGPVVVSADALRKETAAKNQSRPEEPKVEGTLGAMIRAMQHQGAV